MRHLSDEDIEALANAAAEKGAQKAIDELEKRIILHVGQTVLKKLLWMVGSVALAAAIWAVNAGWIK